jgi:hypothetical protein
MDVVYTMDESSRGSSLIQRDACCVVYVSCPGCYILFYKQYNCIKERKGCTANIRLVFNSVLLIIYPMREHLCSAHTCWFSVGWTPQHGNHHNALLNWHHTGHFLYFNIDYRFLHLFSVSSICQLRREIYSYRSQIAIKLKYDQLTCVVCRLFFIRSCFLGQTLCNRYRTSRGESSRVCV